MNNDELIRDIATRAFREALEARSQEFAEDIARRMNTALQPKTAQLDRTKALHDGSQLIAGSRTQSETLETLLAASAAIADTCGLLILRGAQANGWSCHGLTSPDNFKRSVLDCSRGVAAKVITSGIPAETRASELDRLFVSRIGLDATARVVLIPVLLKGHVSALLLALAPEGDEAIALDVLVQVAQLALDLQAYRKASPKPSHETHVPEVHTPEAPSHTVPHPAYTAEAPHAIPPVVEHVEHTHAPQPEHVVDDAQAPEPDRFVSHFPASRPESEPEPAHEHVAPAPTVETIEAVHQPEPAYAAEAIHAREAEPTVEVTPVHEVPPEPAPVPEVSHTEPEPTYAEVTVSPVGLPETHVPPPEPVVAHAPYSDFHSNTPAPQSTSQPQDESHQKARRFAKLLVEEIKLYNQSKVAEGRARGDLYIRLREDIEKSRAAYHKRYGESVRDVDYFTQELLRILADNNRSVMGAGFPG